MHIHSDILLVSCKTQPSKAEFQSTCRMRKCPIPEKSNFVPHARNVFLNTHNESYYCLFEKRKKKPSCFTSLFPQLICRACLEHPHHTLFIIFALVNANKDETFCRTQLSKSAPRQPSPFDLVGFSSDNSVFDIGGDKMSCCRNTKEDT